MRVHISIDDDLLEELDERVGARGRSPFIASALRRALEDERRWEAIADAVGAAGRAAHDWDEDPARWVREQRRSDAGRVG
jgi:metal-responsive CopG/Arc/MetJ family transcriptional regulator